MKKKSFIPALRYPWLTKLFDPIMRITMPEGKIKQSLIDQARIKVDDKVLDFGCGTGTLSIMIKETEPSASVTGIDVDNEILNIAATKVAQKGLDILLVKYEGTTIPYQDCTFDKVLSSLVFHHLNKDQKEKLLKEILRILKPGGELHIADWGKPSNVIMRLLFYPVQFLDGFETTKDNVQGRLPEFIQHAGFWNVSKRGKMNTGLGTLCFYSATKVS